MSGQSLPSNQPQSQPERRPQIDHPPGAEVRSPIQSLPIPSPLSSPRSHSKQSTLPKPEGEHQLVWERDGRDERERSAGAVGGSAEQIPSTSPLCLPPAIPPARGLTLKRAKIPTRLTKTLTRTNPTVLNHLPVVATSGTTPPLKKHILKLPPPTTHLKFPP
jgi:hypothetical protein